MPEADDPDDANGEPRALAPRQPKDIGQRTGAGRVVAGVSLVILVPPVIAAAAGGLGLAVVVGMLSLVAGLIGGVGFVYWQEHLQRRPDEPPPLPRARALPRK
jgi:hypothetical protein